MSIASVRRMAAEITKAGESRIWLDPTHLEDVEKAITKDDVRGLIRQGYVKVWQKKGVSRAKGRLRADKKRKGRSSGFGKRRGTSKARLDPKIVWMARVRSQRKLLKALRTKKILAEGYRDAYNKIKSGTIKDKAHLIKFLKEKGFVKENQLKDFKM